MSNLGEMIPNVTHACYIFADDAEWEVVVASFVAAGLAQHERVSYFADIEAAAVGAAHLEGLGIDVGAHTAAGALDIRRALDTYCPDGRFDPERMLETLRSAYVDAQAKSFAGMRLTGEMTWALRGLPGSERLVEYEARINTLEGPCPGTILCQYDARRFDGATLFDMLSVHPAMMVRGQLVHNPYYTPPEKFLDGLGRRAARG
jgi:hypothetical protein